MKPKFLSQQKQYLKSWIGQEVIGVKRQIFINDKDLENFEQMADGPIEVLLSDSRLFHFVSMVTPMSIGMATGEMPKYGDSHESIDPSLNSFWESRLRKTIQSVRILKSKTASTHCPYEFGLKLGLQDGPDICFEFIDEKDWPETLRIVEKISGSDYVEIEVS